MYGNENEKNFSFTFTFSFARTCKMFNYNFSVLCFKWLIPMLILAVVSVRFLRMRLCENNVDVGSWKVGVESECEQCKSDECSAQQCAIMRDKESKNFKTMAKRLERTFKPFITYTPALLPHFRWPTSPSSALNYAARNTSEGGIKRFNNAFFLLQHF